MPGEPRRALSPTALRRRGGAAYDARMPLPRLIQLAGIVIVTVVMVRSYAVSDMTFQFGGLGVGVAVFVLGKLLERRGRA